MVQFCRFFHMKIQPMFLFWDQFFSYYCLVCRCCGNWVELQRNLFGFWDFFFFGCDMLWMNWVSFRLIFRVCIEKYFLFWIFWHWKSLWSFPCSAGSFAMNNMMYVCACFHRKDQFGLFSGFDWIDHQEISLSSLSLLHAWTCDPSHTHG